MCVVVCWVGSKCQFCFLSLAFVSLIGLLTCWQYARVITTNRVNFYFYFLFSVFFFFFFNSEALTLVRTRMCTHHNNKKKKKFLTCDMTYCKSFYIIEEINRWNWCVIEKRKGTGNGSRKRQTNIETNAWHLNDILNHNYLINHVPSAL